MEIKLMLFIKAIGENLIHRYFKEKEKTKQQYAKGNEYFLVRGANDRKGLLNIIKSIFCF